MRISACLRVALRSGLVLLGLLTAPTAFAATIYTFELDALGAVPLFPGTTQSGWYTATVAGSVPASVNSYAALGIAADPTGGAQALVLTNTPANSAARAQHAFDFSTATQWSIAYDLEVGNSSSSGNSFGTAYIGSFSVVSTSAASSPFTILKAWDSGAANATWSAAYFVYDAGGNALNANGVTPGPAWTGLSQRHWYKQTSVFDTASNKIVSVSITDLTTNAITTFSPTNWYMAGGSGGTFQANAIRFAGFAPSNGMAVDNVSLDALSGQVTPTITSVIGAGGPGTGLCPGCQAMVSGTALGATPVVTVGSKTAYVFNGQVGQLLIQIPVDAAVGSTTLKVGSSAPFNITLAQYAPGLPFNSSAGANGAVAYHVSSQAPVTAANPASPNEQIALTAFGLGPTNPAVATGVSPKDASAVTTSQPTVSVGGKPATVVSSFLTPGSIASYTVVFIVRADAAAGTSPITVSIGGATSNSRDLLVSTAPVITQVVNAASYNPAELPNGPIAQGAIFVIKGSNLGPSAISIAPAAFQSANLSGTSVSVTVGGVTVAPLMYYTSAGQIAALLPSNTPTGTGTISVTYSGQAGAAVPITVTANNLGIFTVTSDGAGAGIVTYADYSLVSTVKAANCGGVYTTCGAANPGDTLILWATGFGPVNGSDAAGTGLGVNQTAVPLTLWLGGVQSTVIYQGRSGCCIGEDQIVFTVPANVPTGCAVPLVVQIGNLVSNTVVMPIAAAGSRTCTAANPAITASAVQQLSGSAPLAFGTISLTRQDKYPGFQDTLKASFGRTSVIPALQPFAASYLDIVPPGSCIAYTNGNAALAQPFASQTGFDAGAQLSVNGPNGVKTVAGQAGSYQGTLATDGTYLSPGSYTVSGAGGADVASFAANLTIPSMPTMTNPTPDSVNAATVTRSSGLNVTWSGGTPNVLVQVTGSSATDSSLATAASFHCTAMAGTAAFTVPPYVLLALPAGGFGGLNFQPAPLPANFQASSLNLAFISAQYDFFSPLTFK
ncbi:MAG TPA: IPT/TIG domain-containing protein [Candidatus Sulfopaludibacter sp.]|nr:IPT/TIG domain-containing protein [Candidatus Sulfopaludibacter sp.]